MTRAALLLGLCALLSACGGGSADGCVDDGKVWVKGLEASAHAPTIGTVIVSPVQPVGNDGGCK
jgi:hypothetical protein